MKKVHPDMKKLMTVQWIAMALQTAILLLHFVPIASLASGGGSVNSLQAAGMYIHKGGVLPILGGCLYCLLVFGMPILSWKATLQGKTRLKYVASIGICALESISSSCFYTMVLQRMSDMLTLNWFHYLLVALEIFDLILFVAAYLLAWDGDN